MKLRIRNKEKETFKSTQPLTMLSKEAQQVLEKKEHFSPADLETVYNAMQQLVTKFQDEHKLLSDRFLYVSKALLQEKDITINTDFAQAKQEQSPAVNLEKSVFEDHIELKSLLQEILDDQNSTGRVFLKEFEPLFVEFLAVTEGTDYKKTYALLSSILQVTEQYDFSQLGYIYDVLVQLYNEAYAPITIENPKKISQLDPGKHVKARGSGSIIKKIKSFVLLDRDKNVEQYAKVETN